MDFIIKFSEEGFQDGLRRYVLLDGAGNYIETPGNHGIYHESPQGALLTLRTKQYISRNTFKGLSGSKSLDDLRAGVVDSLRVPGTGKRKKKEAFDETRNKTLDFLKEVTKCSNIRFNVSAGRGPKGSGLILVHLEAAVLKESFVLTKTFPQIVLGAGGEVGIEPIHETLRSISAQCDAAAASGEAPSGWSANLVLGKSTKKIPEWIKKPVKQTLVKIFGTAGKKTWPFPPWLVCHASRVLATSVIAAQAQLKGKADSDLTAVPHTGYVPSDNDALWADAFIRDVGSTKDVFRIGAARLDMEGVDDICRVKGQMHIQVQLDGHSLWVSSPFVTVSFLSLAGSAKTFEADRMEEVFRAELKASLESEAATCLSKAPLLLHRPESMPETMEKLASMDVSKALSRITVRDDGNVLERLSHCYGVGQYADGEMRFLFATKGSDFTVLENGTLSDFDAAMESPYDLSRGKGPKNIFEFLQFCRFADDFFAAELRDEKDAGPIQLFFKSPTCCKISCGFDYNISNILASSQYQASTALEALRFIANEIRERLRREERYQENRRKCFLNIRLNPVEYQVLKYISKHPKSTQTEIGQAEMHLLTPKTYIQTALSNLSEAQILAHDGRTTPLLSIKRVSGYYGVYNTFSIAKNIREEDLNLIQEVPFGIDDFDILSRDGRKDVCMELVKNAKSQEEKWNALQFLIQMPGTFVKDFVQSEDGKTFLSSLDEADAEFAALSLQFVPGCKRAINTIFNKKGG